VRLLLEADPTLLGVEGNYKSSLVHLAAQEGRLEVLKHLVALGGGGQGSLDVRDSEGRTPLVRGLMSSCLPLEEFL
jgi:hypothetical protein